MDKAKDPTKEKNQKHLKNMDEKKVREELLYLDTSNRTTFNDNDNSKNIKWDRV